MTQETIVAQNSAHLKTLVDDTMREHGPNVDLNHIDVSGILHFDDLFKGTPFTGDISQWDMSNALTLKCMFEDCLFNGDLSKWNVGRVTNMEGMFMFSMFNQSIALWDTSNVLTTALMFRGSPFNQDLSHWNVERNQSTNRMFKDSSFNGNISAWRPMRLIDTYEMFCNSPFNKDVSEWKLLRLQDARGMFNTPSFQQNLGAWGFLTEDCRVDMLVHKTYRGQLPTLRASASAQLASFVHLKMLGGPDALTRYCSEASFSVVHAILLACKPQTCTWASQEELAWSKDIVQTSQSLGAELWDTVDLLVSYKTSKRDMSMDVPDHVFESPT